MRGRAAGRLLKLGLALASLVVYWTAQAATPGEAVYWSAQAATPGKAVFGTLNYSMPTSPRGGTRTATMSGRPEEVAARAFANIVNHGMEILGTKFDAEPLMLTAYISGDPVPYVDCGALSVYDKLQGVAARNFEAATANIVYGYAERDARYVVDRELRMDARVMIEFSGVGDITQVRAHSQYVLTNVLNVYFAGSLIGTSVEIIDFPTSGMGNSESGMMCVATGALESLVVQLAR